LEKHEQNPNGQALFWALDALYNLGIVNSCTVEFWDAMLSAGKELSDKWSEEMRNAKV